MLFIRLLRNVGSAVFNRCPVIRNSIDVPSCAEHERLEFEFLEVRTRGQCLVRLRALPRAEKAEWDRRERAALARLVEHEREHGCGR